VPEPHDLLLHLLRLLLNNKVWVAEIAAGSDDRIRRGRQIRRRPLIVRDGGIRAAGPYALESDGRGFEFEEGATFTGEAACSSTAQGSNLMLGLGPGLQVGYEGRRQPSGASVTFVIAPRSADGEWLMRGMEGR
jgi:hypothetical protein